MVHQVVAALADAEREDLARDGAVLHELEAGDSAIGEDLRDARPHEVHVDSQGCRRGRASQALLQDRGLGEPESRATALSRHQYRQVPGSPQLVQVLLGEGVLAVVDRRALADALEEVVGKECCGIECHASASRSCRTDSSGRSRCRECPAPSTTDREMRGFAASTSSARSPVKML